MKGVNILKKTCFIILLQCFYKTHSQLSRDDFDIIYSDRQWGISLRPPTSSLESSNPNRPQVISPNPIRPQVVAPNPNRPSIVIELPNSNRPSISIGSQNPNRPQIPTGSQIPTTSLNPNRPVAPQQPTTSEIFSPNFDYGSSVSHFSWKLFKGSKLSDPAGNLVLSPVLIQFLLAILEKAAEGETKAQLQNVIRLNDVATLSKLLRSSQIKTAAGIFVDSSQSIDRRFANFVRSVNSQIGLLDFANNPADSKEFINNWASQATNGSINNLIGSGYDIRNMQIILTSAIYFHNKWKYTFNNIDKRTFYADNVPGNEPVGVLADFMEAKQNLQAEMVDVGNGITGTAVSVPYEGDDYCMLLIVPSSNVTLEQFIKGMSYNKFEEIIKNVPKRLPFPVTLQMPKFKINTRFSVVNSLLKMGLTDLFTVQSQLPYIGLSDPPMVSDILQEAILDVDENGTVATAASVALLLPLSSGGRQEYVVKINKPFLSVIIDKRFNAPLFISKIYKP